MGLGGILKPIMSKDNIGIAVGLIAEPIVDSLLNRFIPQQQIGPVGLDDIAGLLLGAFIARRGGLVGGIGKGLVAAKTARIVGNFVGPMLSGMTGGGGGDLQGLTVI